MKNTKTQTANTKQALNLKPQTRTNLDQSRWPLLSFFILHASFCLSVLAQGTAFTYQGRLTDDGNPGNGSNDFKFAVYQVADGGAPVAGPISVDDVPVSNGLFTVTLDFGSGVFTGAVQWLEISVRPGDSIGNYSKLTPRQQMTPTPYALHASDAAYAATTLWSGLNGVPAGFNDGVDNDTTYSAGLGLDLSGTTFSLNPLFTDGRYWALFGNSGTSPGANFLGTTDNQPLELKVNNSRALRLEPTVVSPNVIGGHSANNVDSSAYGATIGGGGSPAEPNRAGAIFSAIGGGLGNTIGTDAWQATIGGGKSNTLEHTARQSTIGGGAFNTIQTSASDAVIGGGLANTIQSASRYATIAGGTANTIERDVLQATIGGGRSNLIQSGSWSATIAGGNGNSIAADAIDSTIGGGLENIAGGTQSAIAGGQFNQALGRASVVAGGSLNRATNHYSTVGGGMQNESFGEWATIAGGVVNVASNILTTIGGGQGNLVLGYGATIGGGGVNQAGGEYGTIAGGFSNEAGGPSSAVGGGSENLAGGPYSTVSGGLLNLVDTNANFATISGGQTNTIRAFAWHATIGGGGNNTVGMGATNSTVAGGRFNRIEEGVNNATIGGGLHHAIGTNSHGSTIGGGFFTFIDDDSSYATLAGGQGNFIRAGSLGAVIGGGDINTVTKNSPLAVIGGGVNNVASNSAVTIPGGDGAWARSYGQFVHASGGFDSIGDAQTSVYLLRNRSTNNATYELFLDGGTRRMVMPTEGVWTFLIHVSAISETSNDFAAYEVRGAVAKLPSGIFLQMRDGSGATVTTAPPIYESGGAVTWQATPYVDVGTGSFRIAVNSAPGQTVKWLARVQTVEIVR